MQFNKFSKLTDSKTGYALLEGQPIFGEKIYLISPRYVHTRSPLYSMVSQKGKHITSLFQGCNGSLVGDYQRKGLIVFLRGEGLGLDIFLSDNMSREQLKAKCCAGELNDQLLEARKAAQ